MKTFNEWVNFRNPFQRSVKWLWETALNEEEVKAKVHEVFRTGDVEKYGDAYVIHGEPKVTLFELDSLGIKEFS